MERDELPLIAENGRARRAWGGVGLVVDEVLEQIDDPVLAQGQLLRLPTRVLDDVDLLAAQDLALGADQGVPTELRELARARRSATATSV